MFGVIVTFAWQLTQTVRDRQSGTDRQTDKQTDRQTDRQRHRLRHRHR